MVPHLNLKQKEAVEHRGGPLLIIAGAGSGKTHTLTSRLKRLMEDGVKPENIVAITFTNKAAKEMANRVTQIASGALPFIGTFHSLGARILKKEARLIGRTASFTIYDNEDSLSLIKNVMKAMDISKEQFNPLAAENKISQVKNELLDPPEYLDKKALLIFEKYERALADNNAFDFDDLLEKVVCIFQKYSEVLEKYRQQFQYILVDEFQDTNTCQYQFVKLLAEKHQNLSVVGDDAQSIYSFRGSDFRNFLNFDSDWPNAKVVKLEQNYRSTPNIIAAASEVIKNNKFQKPKELWTENPAGELVKIIGTRGNEEEAEIIAERINRNSQTHELKNSPTVAILYRTNAQSRAIEQSLISRNIPYKIFGGVKFYERKEVKDVIAALRLAFNPRDTISTERLEKTLPKKTAAALCAALRETSGKFSILELINLFLKSGNYFDYLEAKFKNAGERRENINELIAFASEFKDLGEFLERVSLLQSADAPANRLALGASQFAVNLMSIHLAKGLEFDSVFVIGCNEGTLPHQMSYGSMDELEEERRLMYVAMTRAKHNLCLSFYNAPSRFLYEIPGNLTEFFDLGKREEQKMPGEEDIYLEFD